LNERHLDSDGNLGVRDVIDVNDFPSDGAEFLVVDGFWSKFERSASQT